MCVCVFARTESNAFWLKTSPQKGEIQTIISVVVFPFSYIKTSLYSDSMEKKHKQTQSSQCGTQINGRKQKQYESETDEFTFGKVCPEQLYLMERMD